MRFFIALVACAFSITANAQTTIGGVLAGNGDISFAGSLMTGHLYGNGDFNVNGLTPFQISNPTNGQCLTYNTTLAAWINSSSCGGGGSGTVTSVGLSTPAWLTVGGSPVTTSGTLAITATTGQTANEFLATPNGSPGAVSLRSITLADLPTQTGTGNIVLSISPVLTSPNLDTPTAVNLVNATNLPYSAMPSQAANTILGVTSAGATTQLTPLQTSLMMQASWNVDVIATSNITLSGTQTIDGVSVGAGQTVLVSNQTTGSQNGLYVSASGAWTRLPTLPSGAVLAINCDLSVFIRNGTAKQGHTYFLVSAGGSLTVGTSTLNWADGNQLATPTRAGYVQTTVSGTLVVGQVGTPTAIGDCPSYNDLVGTITDSSNTSPSGLSGPCANTDAAGHLVMTTGGTTTVTGTGCSLNAGSFDGSGTITATGVDTCTLVFGGAYANAPHCGIGNHGATVLANLTSQPTTAHAIFATAAAGSFDYVCF